MLAFDEQAGRAVVVQVTGDTVEWQLYRALQAAAAVAALDAAQLESVHEALAAAVPGDSPQLVLIAGAFDPSALATADWLTRRHGLDISTFAVSVMRFGNERLLSVRREPRDGQAPDAAVRGPVDAHRRSPRAGRAAPPRPPCPPSRAPRLRASSDFPQSSSVRSVPQLRPGLARGAAVPDAGYSALPVPRTTTRATCGSWSDAWSANSALTCTESYSGLGVEQLLRDQDLVEHLGVAVEHVGVLLGLRAASPSGCASPAPSRISSVSENWKSLKSPSTAIGGARVGREDLLDEAADDLRLLVALDRRGLHRRLPGARTADRRRPWS